MRCRLHSQRKALPDARRPATERRAAATDDLGGNEKAAERQGSGAGQCGGVTTYKSDETMNDGRGGPDARRDVRHACVYRQERGRRGERADAMRDPAVSTDEHRRGRVLDEAGAPDKDKMRDGRAILWR